MDSNATPPLATGDRREAGELEIAIGRLARASVLVVGDVMLDRYFYGRVSRISPEAPVPVLSVDREVALPGGAGNVVRNLTALGAAVAFVSVVGDDQSGADLTGLVGGQLGVEPWLLVQGGRATTLKTRYVAQGQHLLRADQEEIVPIHPKLAERLLRIAGDAMAATSVTVLSDYGKGVLAEAVASRLVNLARQIGRPVIVDPRGVDYRCYAGADLIMPSAAELAGETGLPVESDAEVAIAAARLRQQHGFGAVLVLREGAAMTLLDGEGLRHFHPLQQEFADFTGLADSVVAVLAAALAVGVGLGDAAQLAALAGGLVSSRMGTAVAQPGELIAALRLLPEPPVAALLPDAG